MWQNPPESNARPPQAYLQRTSNSKAATASRSDSPNQRCSTITVATVRGATLRRPRPENKSANNESGNNRSPSTEQQREDRPRPHPVAHEPGAPEQISLTLRHPHSHDTNLPATRNHTPVILPRHRRPANKKTPAT